LTKAISALERKASRKKSSSCKKAGHETSFWPFLWFAQVLCDKKSNRELPCTNLFGFGDGYASVIASPKARIRSSQSSTNIQQLRIPNKHSDMKRMSTCAENRGRLLPIACLCLLTYRVLLMVPQTGYTYTNGPARLGGANGAALEQFSSPLLTPTPAPGARMLRFCSSLLLCRVASTGICNWLAADGRSSRPDTSQTRSGIDQQKRT
jgi:hypothetical protein